MRSEAEIFKDLEVLCSKPGYAHVLAYLDFRDSFIEIKEEGVTGSDFSRSYEPDRLLRTEMSTLIGLAVKGKFNTDPIFLEEINSLIEETNQLLRELQANLQKKIRTVLAKAHKIELDLDTNSIRFKENPFKKAQVLREPIFYGAESAYPFQYRDLGPLRYNQDNEWLQKHKGFCIQDAQDIIKAILEIRNKKIEYIMCIIELGISVEFIPFHAFTFTLDEITEQSNCSSQTVKNTIDAFCLGTESRNQNFNSINDFNEITARPIIKINNSVYLLLQSVTLLEAMYESPFYWMINDKNYKDTASKHRGDFTEQFCKDRLKVIFGEKNVHKNVKFEKDKGEIDVLVTYSNRAIILQAKSKKLTLEARRGNDDALRSDFQAAVQDAYNQGFECAKLLNEKDLNILDENGNLLKIRRNFREIYIFTIVAEHYPSLTFQAEQFLQYEATETVPPPFVMDIFFLDTLCELIQSPLYFLDFVQRRIKYVNRIVSPNEFAILAHHLKYNLHVPDDKKGIIIDQSCCLDMDKAMNIRREDLPGDPNIQGILTKFRNRTFGKIIQHISQSEQDGILDIGFFLLHWNESVVKLLEDGIKKITNSTRADKKLHNFFLMVEGVGLTFHTSYLEEAKMAYLLHCHCAQRKYETKASKWFGLAKNVNSDNPFDVGLILDCQWEHSNKMEKIMKGFADGKAFSNLQTAPHQKKKIGRNEPCPCGSGKKYKKCHGK